MSRRRRGSVIRTYEALEPIEPGQFVTWATDGRVRVVVSGDLPIGVAVDVVRVPAGWRVTVAVQGEASNVPTLTRRREADWATRAFDAGAWMAGQAHPLGTTVCAPGHRHRLTVVAFEPEKSNQTHPPHDGAMLYPDRYTLQDERNPAVQPFDVVRVPARNVKPYGWEPLLCLCEPFGGSAQWAWLKASRGAYLDACAHLHDLGDHDNADELLNEAAQRWWEDCDACGGEGNGNDDGTPEGEWMCMLCHGAGRVSRITDDHRLRLIEALIAAGLPERKRGLDYSEMKAMVEAATPGPP